MKRAAWFGIVKLFILWVFAQPGFGQDYLSLCSKCVTPTVTLKKGIGTSNAIAEAKVTRNDAKSWCENWQSGDSLEACIKEQLSSYGKDTYRASANCLEGKITTIEGESYTLAGLWTSDVGRGRTKWRDASGAIIGQDNASNGLAISQQWRCYAPDLLR